MLLAQLEQGKVCPNRTDSLKRHSELKETVAALQTLSKVGIEPRSYRILGNGARSKYHSWVKEGNDSMSVIIRLHRQF